MILSLDADFPILALIDLRVFASSCSRCRMRSSQLVHRAGEEEGDLLHRGWLQAPLGGEGADGFGQGAVGGGAPAAGGSVPVALTEAFPVGGVEESRVPEAIKD